jgi:hypothetical protein
MLLGTILFMARRNAFRNAWKKFYFWPMMWLAFFVTLGGFYFSYHLIMLLVEQYESIEDN